MKKTIKMARTIDGSQDGVTVETFQDKKIYTIEDSLADVFLEEKWAVMVMAEDPVKIKTPETIKPAKKKQKKAKK